MTLRGDCNLATRVRRVSGWLWEAAGERVFTVRWGMVLAKHHTSRYRANRVAAGLCGYCGATRNQYKWLCDACAEKHRNKQRAKTQARRTANTVQISAASLAGPLDAEDISYSA